MKPLKKWIPRMARHSSSDAFEAGQQSPEAMAALNLTGRITKLDDHFPKAGGFSDVYKCRYTTPDGVKEVAVKAFRFHLKMAENEENQSKTDKNIRRELEIWSMLRHPNIVPFLGFVYDFGRPGSISLVSDWMPNGTLDSFCAQYDHQLMLGHRLRLLLDTASGLAHLHSFSMVHGDLTCTNVLIDHNFNARLTDFGLTSIVGDIPEALRYLQVTSMRPGAIRWAAPEHFPDNANAMIPRTTKSDIYSFGNLSLFTLSGKHPWSEVRLDISVILRLHQGEKPDRPMSPAIEDKHWEFIQHCWSAVDRRPQAEDVVVVLKRFIASCPPVKPLRNSMCIPFDTIEPSHAALSSHAMSKASKRVRFNDTGRNSPTLPRKPSWHGQIPPGPHSPTQSTTGLKRGRSFDGRSRRWENPSPQHVFSSHFQIHHFLNGGASRMDLYFDLASPSFNLHPRVSPGQTIAISEELQQNATFPPITRMRITHDAIPQWPIDLEYRQDDPSITVGDVLYTIYLSLHRQVMQHEWAQLGHYKGDAVSDAYARRFRSVPSLANVEASQGVKRIDYLLDKHIFRGLVKTHDEGGFYCWKLIIVTDLEYQHSPSPW